MKLCRSASVPFFETQIKLGNEEISSVYTGFSKAFDKMNHKLSFYGICGMGLVGAR